MTPPPPINDFFLWVITAEPDARRAGVCAFVCVFVHVHVCLCVCAPKPPSPFLHRNVWQLYSEYLQTFN